MLKEEEIQKLAELARIEVAPTERAVLAGETDRILAYISELEKVMVEKTAAEEADLRNMWREDQITHAPGEHSQALLSAASGREGDYLAVKKVL